MYILQCVSWYFQTNTELCERTKNVHLSRFDVGITSTFLCKLMTLKRANEALNMAKHHYSSDLLYLLNHSTQSHETKAKANK
jgi:hypothetical protein